MQSKDTAKKFDRHTLMRGLRIIIVNGLEHKTLFLSALGLMVAYSIIDPFDTYLIGRFIDALTHDGVYIVPGTSIEMPLYAALLMCWFLALSAEIIVARFRAIATRNLGELTRISYITKFIGHTFRLPLSYHKSVRMGEVQEHLTKASSAAGEILSNDIVLIGPQFISVLIFLGVLATLNKTVFVIAIVAIVIYTAVTIMTIKPTVPLQREVHRLYARIRGIAQDSIMNIKIIKDFNAEQTQLDAIRKGYVQDAMPVWNKMVGIIRNQNMYQSLIIAFARGFVLLLSIYLVRNGSWSIGDLVIANGYLGQVFGPINQLSNNWRNLQNGILALEDTEKVLALSPEKYVPSDSPKHMSESTTVAGKIQFNDVSFGYSEGNSVLKNISFTVEPGQIVAFVGESGVGKSSLIDLISAYYFPSSGSITIDDIPIQQVPLDTLRNSIGIVTQEITLFNDTIENNLRFGSFTATPEEIHAAAQKAHCLAFIEKFPEKWAQVVGERGLKLSVGQKQRIAIARAILKNPKILILDEPTSALDAGSEKIITESLDELMQGKTTFVVAHRLSTVRRANKILVFKEGRIIESGTHDELVTIPGGEYRRLYELQIGLHA